MLVGAALARHLGSEDRPAAPARRDLLLSDPFLQLPGADSVSVVWFTEWPGDRHEVLVGPGVDRLGDPTQVDSTQTGSTQTGSTQVDSTQVDLAAAGIRVVPATTTELSRTAEDARSEVPGRSWDRLTRRRIWRHEARVEGLSGRLPYRVRSIDGPRTVWSDTFTLGPAPPPGTPLRILLTSDHQQMPMTAANLAQVVDTVGRPDAVFFAGDLVNVADRASEWFDSARGGFFPLLQGRGDREIAGHRYRGGEIIQHAPLFPAVGNHEVMGRRDAGDLDEQFESPLPRPVARRLLRERGLRGEELERQVLESSFNTVTYQEMFTLPADSPGGETYYAVTVGDVRLISLYVTHIWRERTTEPDRRRSAYVERSEDLGDPWAQGWGQHIFEPIRAGSVQYRWLADELASEEFASARYRVVMLHHPVHSLGDHVVPAFTDPVRIEERDDDGRLTRVRYEYPAARDHLLRDLEPLLVDAGVDLVLNGHSHLWNRFRGRGGVHYLETSNVGNTYGAFVRGGPERFVPPPPWPTRDATPVGDPAGLRPEMPTGRAPGSGRRPYVSSNTVTVFSVLDTSDGTVRSWAFDTERPEEGSWLLDEFRLGGSR